MGDNGKIKVLVIDDEEEMLVNCGRIIGRLGYECLKLKDSNEAAAVIAREAPYVILTDFAMPGRNGLDILRLAKEIEPETVVILISGYATIPSVVEAMKEGAFDYLAKPFSAEQLRVALERAVRNRKLSEENRYLRSQLAQTLGFDNMIGTSMPMREVFETVRKVSATDANVLIYGESGTGKELVARSIHANSDRKDNPFVPVDCASLPENLLESELFGHEKGTFTGADATRPGLLEFANSGTFFLDEIGEMGINLQAKLLRVLQERQFRRVGGRKMIDIDIRVIAATHRDLEEGIRKGTFREDLYYRLNVVPITLPPLRDRAEDIPVLVEHFLPERFRDGYGLQAPAIDRLHAAAVGCLGFISSLTARSNSAHRVSPSSTASPRCPWPFVWGRRRIWKMARSPAVKSFRKWPRALPGR